MLKINYEFQSSILHFGSELDKLNGFKYYYKDTILDHYEMDNNYYTVLNPIFLCVTHIKMQNSK